jgi:hypothetical protein
MYSGRLSKQGTNGEMHQRCDTTSIKESVPDVRTGNKSGKEGVLWQDFVIS